MKLFLNEDLAVNVLTSILRAYLAETTMDHLAGMLKKGGIKDLLIFFPPNRRTDSVLDAHFRGAGLSQVVDWWTRKQNALIKEDIAKAIKESLEHDDQPSDVRFCPGVLVFFVLKQKVRPWQQCEALSRSGLSPNPRLS